MGFFEFLNESYGAFVGYTCLLVFVTTVGTCFLKEACRKYYGIEICKGTPTRQSANEIRQDAEVAMQMQQQLNAEERARVRLENQRKRRKKYEKILGSAKMVVAEGDLHSPPERDDDDIEACVVRTSEGEYLTSDEAHLMLDLPLPDSLEEMRRVPAQCAVCIADYEVGDSVIWSTNDACPHVFHEDCILTWLSKGKRRCPCCRQFFVDSKVTPIESRNSDVSDATGEEAGDGVDSGENSFGLDITPTEMTEEGLGDTQRSNEESGEIGAVHEFATSGLDRLPRIDSTSADEERKAGLDVMKSLSGRSDQPLDTIVDLDGAYVGMGNENDAKNLEETEDQTKRPVMSS